MDIAEGAFSIIVDRASRRHQPADTSAAQDEKGFRVTPISCVQIFSGEI
jgi:hypothetical protein